MADFSKTAISQNAKREYTNKITSDSTFETLISTFEDDTTMGITITPVSATYKGKVTFFDANSDKKGYLLIYAESKEQYSSLSEALTTDFIAEAANGEDNGGASSENVSYTAKFSCVNKVTVSGREVEDTFTVTIGTEYMSVTGYTYESTIEKIEAWADAQSAIS